MGSFDTSRLPIDGLTFDRPFILLALLAIPLLWIVAGPRLRGVPAGQRRATLLTRTIITALLILALSEPTVRYHPQSLQLVFAVDRSTSMNEAQQRWISDWVTSAIALLRPDDRAAVVSFGRSVNLGPTLKQGTANAEQEGTNLEGAVRTAAALLPGHDARQVVLLTDGWETEGHVQASDTLSDGLSVSYVAPPLTDAKDVSIRGVEAPSHTRIDEPLDARVTIDSVTETEGVLRIWLDERPAGEQRISLNPGANVLTVTPRLRSTGFHTIRAEISADGDARAENNGGAVTTVTKDAGRALVLEERAGEGRNIAATLSESGIAVEVKPVTAIPTSPDDLRSFDSIILTNVPTTTLSLDQQRTLQIFVRDMGRGLLVAGGPRAFARGGYEGSVLEEMLPVSSTPPARRRQGNVALVLVIDKSGSMDLFRSDVSKISMAREAAIQATDLLQSDDYLGVVAFDSRMQWVVPTTRLRTPDDLKQAQARISTIQADGGTNIYPALEAAYDSIAGVDARLKHVVLLTDGQSFSADYAGLIQRMRPREITLSTVAVGADADTKLLTQIAGLGEGRYYFTERSAEIPRIASKEANILTRNATVEGTIQVLTGEASPILRGIAPEFPPLNGYIGTTPRYRAVTALGTDRGDPLLAHWQYGLGRVVAWTSDTRGLWSGPWLAAPEAERVWAQAVRWSMPEPQAPELRVSTTVDGSTVTIRAESVRSNGTFADLLETRATVVTPAGDAVEARLPQSAPGTYELRTEAPGPGAYRVLISQYEQGKVAREEMGGFVIIPAPETRGLGINTPLLDQITARTGGRALSSPSDVLSLTRARTNQTVHVWPWLLAISLVLFPLDVAIRRLRWPWFRRPEH